MKNLLVVTMLLGAMVLFSCNNGNQKEEILRLKAQNELLTKCIMKFATCSIPGRDSIPFIEPIPTIGEMAGLIDNLETSDVIQIPTSWTLESAQLMDMLTHSDMNGNFAQGLHAYAIVEGGSLKFALIPYYTNNSSGEVNDIVDDFKAYNYSHMCPPNQNCAHNSSVFGVVNTTYTFKK